MIFKQAKLRDINGNDLELILNWRNQESIRKVMYHSEIISMVQHLQWFQRLQKNESAISKLFYWNNVPYGVLNINRIDRINNKCEWGFYIGDKNAPRGMGTILGFTSLNYIFNELSFRKLCAEVLSNNEKSIIFHQKFGFEQEGTLRKHIIKEGSYINIILYGLLKEEWEVHSLSIQRLIKGRYL